MSERQNFVAGLVVQDGQGVIHKGEDSMRRFGASVLLAAAAMAVLTPERVASDGKSDLIVGMPGRNNNTGEVDPRLTTAPGDIRPRIARP